MSFIGDILKSLFAENTNSPVYDWRDHLPAPLRGVNIDSTPIIKYVRKRRNGRNQRVGVILAFLRDNQIYVGFSLTKLSAGDVYDHWEGLELAYDRAIPPYGSKFLDSIPHSILDEVLSVRNRAWSYYKQASDRQTKEVIEYLANRYTSGEKKNGTHL